MFSEPKLSVIVPTLGRVIEVDELLKTIEISEYKPYEIILVDQNLNDGLDYLVEKYNKMNIKLEKVNFKGTSRAKNYGAKYASGEILCFPDDDCEVYSNTFSKALEMLQSKEVVVVFGKTVDRAGKDSVIKYAEEEQKIDRNHLNGTFIEATMFIKRDVFSKYLFDEKMGVGEFFGAEEVYDLVLRMLKDKVRMFYSPAIVFYHPQKILEHASESSIRRVFSYRCGFAHLCVKHKMYKKLSERIFKVLLYLGYLAVFNRKKIRYYFSELAGLMAGTVIK